MARRWRPGAGTGLREAVPALGVAVAVMLRPAGRPVRPSFRRTGRDQRLGRLLDEVLDELALVGDERVADLGCRRGLLLVAVARRLATGRVTGVDPWRRWRRSAGSEVAVARTVELAGVGPRVRLVRADLRALPLPDASADVVVSGLALHALRGAERRLAVGEAWRVLAPGGRLRIVDARHVSQYAEVLRAAGADVEVRGPGRGSRRGLAWGRRELLCAAKPLVLAEADVSCARVAYSS